MTHLVYFAASDGDDGVHGRELWVTDGTPAGTRMVKDINPNNNILPVFRGSDPQALADMGDGRVIFRARDDIFGGRDELWVSDGTPSGTFMVKNIGGSLSSEPGETTQLRPGVVVFTATDGISAAAGHTGRELWISDGTSEGTRLLKDINPGVSEDGRPLSSDPYGFVAIGGGRVLFTADDGTNGRELWVTDGTAAGTRMLVDLRPGPESGMLGKPGSNLGVPDRPVQIFDLGNGRALFGGDNGIQGYELWVTDGTAGGTQLLRDLREGPEGFGSFAFTPLADGRVKVVGDPNTIGTLAVVTDGTVAGTVRGVESHMTSLPVPTPVFAEPVAGKLMLYGGSGGIQLPDGRLLFVASQRIQDDEGNISIGGVNYSFTDTVLAVSDGTLGGTRPLMPQGEDPSSFYDSFRTMPDGRILFRVDGDIIGLEPEIWITDGTPLGTAPVTSEIRTLGNFNWVGDGKVLLTSAMKDGGYALWLTDGTRGGTQKLAEGISSYEFVDVDLGYGKWLFTVFRGTTETPSGATRRLYDFWVTDGTASGTKQVASGLDRFEMEQITPLGPNAIVFTYNDGVHSREPWMIDFNTASAKLLADIVPGPVSAGQWHLTAVRSADIPVPISNLFEQFASMEGEAPIIPLDDYFDDPTDPRLDYIVSGLPAGVSFEKDSATIEGKPVAAPGTYSVTVVAQNDERGAVASSFDWTVVDTGLLRLSSSGGWGREKEGGPIAMAKGSTLLIGRKDGPAEMLRIEGGEATVEGNKLTVKGKVFSPLQPTAKPLMEGSFAIDMKSLAVSDFKDDRSKTDFDLLGGLLTLDFAAMALKTDSVAFATDITFGGSFGALNTEKAPISFEVGAGGLSFGPALIGTGGWSSGAQPFNVPGTSTMTLKFDKLGIFYDMLADDIFLNGKATLAWGGTVAAQFSFLKPGKQSGLTLDLAGKTPDDVDYALGDKYLRLGFDAAGNFDWDIVGEVTYTGKGDGILPKGFPKLTELKLSLDTPKSEFKGSMKAELPFMFYDVELEAEVGAKWKPEMAIDSFSFGVDNLNIAIGTTPLFLQGGKLAAENLTAAKPGEGPAYSAAMKFTLGPTYDNLPSVLRGSLTGKVEPKKMTLGIEIDSKFGYFLPAAIEYYAEELMAVFKLEPEQVTEFKLLEAKGNLTADFGDLALTASLETSVMGGLYTGTSKVALFSYQKAPAFTASSKGVLKFPDPIPLVGGMSIGGYTATQYIYDDKPDNDFVAGWAEIKLPGGRLTGSVGMGIKIGFDQSWSFIGRKGVELVGSWDLSPQQEIVILSAYWDTPSEAARLELILPGGQVLTEADFAARDDIGLVDDLNTPTARHVAIATPAAGRWDLRLADPTGLGTVRTEASEMLLTPVARIVSVDIDDALQAEITLEGPDSMAAPVSLFLSPEPEAAAGLGIVSLGTLAPGQTLTTLEDLAALEPGEWWLHARTEAEGHIPGLDMFATPITVSGAADLGVTLLEGRHPESGSRTVTVEVANTGERSSGAGSLRVDVDAALLGGKAVAGFVPLAAADALLPLANLAPGAAQSFAFVLPEDAPAGSVIRLTAEAAAWEANPADNSLIYVLSGFDGTLGGTLLARNGMPMAGTELSLRLADGRVLAATTGDTGRFDFDAADIADAVLEGPAWSAAAGPAITTSSALEALRMAVGLRPSWGPPRPDDFVAADVNGDGRVTTADALEILRTAVGLPSSSPPRWVFFEADHDFGTVTAATVPRDIAPDFGDLADPTDLTLIALLTGSVQAWT